MTPSLTRASAAHIDQLPATKAGLWTAILITHGVVVQRIREPGGIRADGLADVAARTHEAADIVATSSSTTLEAVTGSADPQPVPAPPEGPPLERLCTECIHLAVAVLGNEAHPLTPFEVLGITRAVTVLCAVRAALQDISA